MSNLKNTITRFVARKGLVLSKHAPTIMMAAGAVGVVGTAVLAAKATLGIKEKVYPVLEDIDSAKDQVAAASLGFTDGRHEKVQLLKAYGRLGLVVTKAYAPTVVVGLATISLGFKSHEIMLKRNTALVGAYSLLEAAYSKYREVVAEELGEDREREIHRVVMEKGNVYRPSEDGAPSQELVGRHDGYSVYARLFDELNPNWKRDNSVNRFFLQSQQVIANERLQAMGHLFLNEVYDMLGITRTPAGQLVGWVYGSGKGDDFVDFGLWDVDDPSKIRFAKGENGRNGIMLDFNVDGQIHELI